MTEMPGMGGQPNAGQSDGQSAGADLIKDSSIETFAADVLEASMQQPVIVDFWAPWCEPCKQLTPILEKIVKAAAGAVRMVKVNIDENPQIAQQLQVQSIPAVFGFKQGQPVDGFMGAVPESQVKDFVERLAGEIGPSPVDQILEQAQAAFEAKDFNSAAQAFSAVIQQEPGNPAAVAGLTRCFLEAGEVERAREVLDQSPEEIKNDADISSAWAAVELAEQGAGAGLDSEAIAALNAKIQANPKDMDARLELSQALMAGGDQQGAADVLLDMVALDRAWNEEAARKQLVTLFEALGPTHEITATARRRLSSILFS